MVSRIRVVLGLLMMGLSVSAASVEAKPARPAPPLAAPVGPVVNVNTEAQLQAAVRGLTSNTTIVIAPGTYVLTATLYVKGVTNVGIRGATNNSDDVVLVGPGMANPNYGSVPFGIWTGQGVDGVTIANLTIRDLYYHPLIFNGGTENPRVYNVHLINAGEQVVKVNPDGLGGGVDNGIVEYSVIEYETGAKNDYTKGVDIQTARNWIIRHNLFRNIVAPPGQIAGPAILAWRGTSDTLVEGNTFLNCARGVMFGADDYYSPSHRGGIIRNNVFFRTAGQPGDVGIILSDSPGSQVLGNTLFLSATYSAPIEYRYPGTNNVLIANNLLDGVIQSRDGGSATLATNHQGAGPGTFVDAAAGDLHLSALAAPDIDRGTPFPALTDDWDGQSRPQGAGYDIGADERGASTASYRISGRVLDARGAALAGVTLTLSGGQSRTTATDGDGRFGFTTLAGGAAYTITPSRAGYTFMPGSQYYAVLNQDQTSADFMATATPLPGGGTTAATFLRADVSTRGNWRGTYGGDGYGLIGAGDSYPAYAKVSVTGAAGWMWSSSTTDVRALQRPGSSDRLAACWYAAGSFNIDINLTDGQVHQVALYSIDFDNWGRAQRVDVLDAATGAVLETRSLSNFQGGQYFVWALSGHVILRLANTGPQNSVASGLFFDAIGTSPPTPTTSATFTRTDTLTRGSWRGAYGGAGYVVAGDATLNPSWAAVSIASASSWTWGPSTPDPRATQRAAGSDRVAACWYSPGAFKVDVTVVDGASHQVALYVTDFDRWGRSQRIEVLDAATGVVLDTRDVVNFDGGQYLVWTVKGSVTFRVSNSGYPNAVLSGVFFD